MLRSRDLRRLWAAAILVTVCLASAAPAVPVRADAPGGVAASTIQYAPPLAFKEIAHLYVILGVDGTIYYQRWELYDDAPQEWHTLAVEWPVPLDQIAEWVPGPGFAWDELSVPEMLIGLITTVEGDVWRHEIDWAAPTWDSAGTKTINATRWERLTCESCLE